MRVAIIGAGICGLYLAWKLSERGEEVTVFEKRGKIGKEACSGLFSERILEFIPQSQNLIQNKINYCLINFPTPHQKLRFGTGQERTLEVKFSRKFLVMRHSELDNLAANLAQNAGARIILNHNVTRRDLLIFQNGFDKIIGCDGAISEVRKYLNLPGPKFRLGLQNLYSSSIAKENYVETWPTPSGFIWKIPRAGQTEYGIIEKPENAKKLFENFLKNKWLEARPLTNRISSALIPQGLIIPKNSKVTICGDAAGLTKPWSGGGVIWGLIAANFLLKNFPDFVKYKNEAQKFFLPKIIFSKIAKQMIYFLGFKFPWILPKNYQIEGDFLI